MKKIILTAAAAAALTAGSAAFAAGAPMMAGVVNPWHVGVGLNYSALSTDNFKDNNGGTGADNTYKLKNRGLGVNLFAGYRVNHYFGVEAGLAMLGSDKYKGFDADNQTYKPYHKLSSQWNLHMVGQAFLPVTSWFSPYAFAGVAYIHANAENNEGDPTAATNNIENFNYAGFGMLVGGGLQFNFNQFGVRASYTHVIPSTSMTTQTGNNGILTDDMPITKDYVSLDVLYRFG